MKRCNVHVSQVWDKKSESPTGIKLMTFSKPVALQLWETWARFSWKKWSKWSREKYRHHKYNETFMNHVNHRNSSNPNYHMSTNKCQKILKSFIDLKYNAWFTLGVELGVCDTMVTPWWFLVKRNACSQQELCSTWCTALKTSKGYWVTLCFSCCFLLYCCLFDIYLFEMKQRATLLLINIW